MNKGILFFVLGLSFWMAGTVYAAEITAEASLEKEIRLHSNMETVVKWIDSHKDAIRKESGTKVLKDHGKGKLEIQRISKKGVFTWICQETITKTPDKVIYKTVLVKSIEGGLVYSNSTMTVEPSKKGTTITINSSAGLNNPRVTGPEIRIDMNMYTNRVKDLIHSSLK